MSRFRSSVAALSVAVACAACAHSAPQAAPEAPRFIAAPTMDPAIRDKDIAFFAQRLREDPESAADRSRLALLYLSRSRERGDFADVARAESLAVRSLAQRESHNGGTWSILAAARLAKHDFAGALDAGRRYLANDSTSPTARALVGEILLETGGYDEARALFTSIEPSTSLPSVASRLARWYELTGRIDQARTVARYAARVARLDGGLSREQIAWFQMRVGDLALKRGDLAESDSAYRFALEIFPGDYRVLAATARLAAVRGEWKAAIAAGEQAVAVQLDPATLGLLAGAWAALGDTAQSAAYAKAMTVSALTQPGAIHRAWGLYLVDHHQRTHDVLRRVRQELETRQDVYGYDLLAWTLHAQGKDREAWQAARKALAQGTEDAQIAFHAAEIARALGDTEEANRQMQRVAAINPTYLQHRHAAGSATLALSAAPPALSGR